MCIVILALVAVSVTVSIAIQWFLMETWMEIVEEEMVVVATMY